MAIIDDIRALIAREKTVQRVAEDQYLTAELIMLVRMMFADGKMKTEEIEKFKLICVTSCGISKKDIPDVIKYLSEFGYETTAENAALMFAEMDMDRKRVLLRRLVQIAGADKILDPRESLMIQKTAETLGLTMLDAFAPE